LAISPRTVVFPDPGPPEMMTRFELLCNIRFPILMPDPEEAV
jgi:hypothetical protein